MSPRSARRLGVLSTALLLTTALLAPSVASAAPSAAAASLGPRGSGLRDEAPVRTAAVDEIEVRDLAFACPEGAVPAGGFGDVPASFTFARAIDCLVWYGVTKGKTATTYAPNDHVTRQQMAVFLHRLLDHAGIPLPPPPRTSRFRDVPITGEAGEAINVLSSPELADILAGERIVAGRTTTEYDPAGRVTRAQMGSFIARVLRGVAAYNNASLREGHCGDPSRPDVGCFPDEHLIATTHRPNVAQLYRFGIVTGRTDGTYGPSADVSRAQMAAFLMRLTDVFVEAEVMFPPDTLQELFVDRGDATTACTGGNGSLARPYCSIQAAVDVARTMERKVVDVVVFGRDGQPAYTENVRLSSGSAYEVNIIAHHAQGHRVPLVGDVRISGAAEEGFNLVMGLRVDAPIAFDVRTDGFAMLWDVETIGTTGVRLDQGGGTLLADAELDSTTTSIDVVRAFGDGAYGAVQTTFTSASSAYVLLPTDVTAARATAIFDEDFLHPDLENAFVPGAVHATHGSGRQALVPAT